MVVRNSTPLIALDAVVIDTETTGLDPAEARIVEIAGIRIVGGRLSVDEIFQSLVSPGVSIPPAATAIHHIDDAKVAGAPRFADVWPALVDFIGGAVLIGHNIGFDLAVLDRECKRANLVYRHPWALDTRLLAETIEPMLAVHTIESLATWLGIQSIERHSAKGDAITTARIFAALVVKLRDGGIRTLGEATLACRALTTVLEEQHHAGWVDTGAVPAVHDAERTLARIDSYPYRHRIKDVMQTPAKFVSTETPLAKALKQMMAERVSSLFVGPAESNEGNVLAEDIGIVTERDGLRAIATHGAEVLARPVKELMSKPLAVVPADAFIYLAIGRMSRLAIRHLGVVNEAGHVVGALSARDLLRLRASEAISLGDEIDEATDAHALGAAWAKLPHVAAALLAEDVSARDIAAVISDGLCGLTRKAALIAEERLRKAGNGAPPCAYSVAVLGSAGRGESLLSVDQDNAIIFAEGEPGGSNDAWFEKLGIQIADTLHEVGVPYCTGGVMAKNPRWRGSMATWHHRIEEWMRVSRPEDLLAVDIFFDLRPVHGDGRLCTTLWRQAYEVARGRYDFAKLLAEAAGRIESGLGLFRQFKTKEGRIDLKKAGLFGIVSSTRVLAICHHVVERSTPARLAGIKALGIGAETDLDALADAQETFIELILAQQIDDVDHGIPPSNAITVKRLSSNSRSRLRTALEAVQHLEALQRDLLFKA
jgi:CBS domain-containing protein